MNFMTGPSRIYDLSCLYHLKKKQKQKTKQKRVDPVFLSIGNRALNTVDKAKVL